MKKLFSTLLLISLLFLSAVSQEKLNKNLFEHHIICQQLKLYDGKYYLKVVNNNIYFYDKTSGKQLTSIVGANTTYSPKSHSINNGQGIMYNLKKGYSYYTYYDWVNHYRAKVGSTVDSGRHWKEIADFDQVFPEYSHKNEHIFVPDSNIIIIYGMRSVFLLKKQYTTDRYKSVMIDNIEYTCLPNREGYVNADRFNHITLQNYIYVSHDGGLTWKHSRIPESATKGFTYNNPQVSTFNGSLKANMSQNSLIWFEIDDKGRYIITLNNGSQLVSKDRGLNWK